ncbi:hypothetical protein E4U42_006280 [Claviceps africana]|uniref:Uncharacterized protein n=1 Tax=Claviceps africana TaxID=83212 RepID=A0A8K0J3H8_9HYPO|nr:hypothetical protein E4U42_006280 [Claviceps africana]
MLYQPHRAHTPDALPYPSYSQCALLDDAASVHGLPLQMPPRLANVSSGQRAGTSTMRVSKPNSTNGSPRGSSMLSRRRSMMGNDVWTPQRQQQVLDHVSARPRQASRPVSWHPSTHVQHQYQPQYQPQSQQHQQHHLEHPQVVLHQPSSQHQQYLRQQQAAYAAPTPSFYGGDYTELYAGLPHFSPTMTSYSNDTSPCSTFSPLPTLPASNQGPCTQTPAWDASNKSDSVYNCGQTWGVTDPDSLRDQVDTRSSGPSGLDWNSFIMQGFNSTTPPTPETFSHARQPPVIPEPYEPLDEPEEEGEILFGMGLYDAPDKVCQDPQLNHYRSTVSSLLGAAPKGKGLKLEETWEPPTKTGVDADADDDDDEDDDDDDEDGDDGDNNDDDDDDEDDEDDADA